MNYLVVSDNHGDREILVELVKKYEGAVDKMFHCGDSELPPTDALWEHFVVVKGNCDYAPEYQEQRLVTVGGDRVFITHGHLSNVRLGLTTLSLQAQEEQANIALFGHIHVAVAEYENGILFVNPGSISQPRGLFKVPTYAIIESTETDYQVTYLNRAHQEIEELSVVLKK